MAEKKNLVCDEADSHGPVAIHGTTSAFYSNDHPVLKILFRIFKEFDWMSEDNQVREENIGGDLESAISQSRHDGSYCANKLKTVISSLKESSVKAKAYRKDINKFKSVHKRRRN